MDEDLDGMDHHGLRAEVARLRKAIRRHRDERGHGRCWLDDARLYATLPEDEAAHYPLPPRDEFLKNCGRYWEERQRPGDRRRRSGPIRALVFAAAKRYGIV